MRAYKGFTRDLVSRLGDGKEETCCFIPGETKEVEASKTVSCGFHCCENPFECLRYYALDGENRFFVVEAAGDIDEDEDERIACTRITLVKELTPFELALEGMRYMVSHPMRQRWQQSGRGVTVMPDRAEAKQKGSIAIARGGHPVVTGVEGSILGLILETDGMITEAKLFVVSGQQSGREYTLTAERKLKEVSHAEEAYREYTAT